MKDQEPTLRARELGEEVTLVMEEAGLNGRQLAIRLGWSTAKVSRLLSGKRPVSEVDLAYLLGTCNASRERTKRLLKLWREVSMPVWLETHSERLPEQLRSYITHEHQAAFIGDYQATLVPGLLQTADYARSAMIGTKTLTMEEIASRVPARLERQRVFTEARKAEFAFFVHEFALRLPVGGPAVMSAQLHRLLEMSVRPYLKLRVVPAEIGSHPAALGSFILMDFTEFRSVVYLESELSAQFLEVPAQVSIYRRILKSLAEVALDEGESRELIANLATGLYGYREDCDDFATARRDCLAYE
ncbi:helix-turn-helix domain-containing protein [Amycolatopsis nigrescens]|uniref:helix-turn-helix domain-containing protein n=1 Tax=Amycolatopsis nigrescens TaxID=381445 RepID=UPI0012F8AC34|nr:helix-turn-helix transcriptional regulator [Amycolatopsis nigrescens]